LQPGPQRCYGARMQQNAPVRYRTFVYDSSRWDGFRFRAGDIVISTPPKCGTTWTQRICSLLILQTTELELPLSILSPWVDMLTRPLAEVIADLEGQQHRRFIKTHTPLDGLPWDPRVTYICVARDPRDVALSWDGHIANADVPALFAAREAAVGNEDIQEMLEKGLPEMPATPAERFWLWVDDDEPVEGAPSSLRGVLNHLESFWKRRHEPNIVLLHYHDLKGDLDGQMRALAATLGIAIEEKMWPQLVEAATFETMRAGADRIVPGSTESIWQSNRQFFRSGESGQWRELLDEEGMRRYEARVANLVSPELAQWVHHGAIR